MSNNIELEQVVVDVINKERRSVIEGIKKVLAGLHIQYHNLRSFHWNVTGPHFFTLHAKFEELYTDISAKVDESAERILTLGAKPGISISDYSSLTDLSDGSNVEDAREMVQAVIEGNELLLRDIHQLVLAADSSGDEGTADLFTGYMSDLQKTNWMLKAFLG